MGVILPPLNTIGTLHSKAQSAEYLAILSHFNHVFIQFSRLYLLYSIVRLFFISVAFSYFTISGLELLSRLSAFLVILLAGFRQCRRHFSIFVLLALISMAHFDFAAHTHFIRGHLYYRRAFWAKIVQFE